MNLKKILMTQSKFSPIRLSVVTKVMLVTSIGAIAVGCQSRPVADLAEPAPSQSQTQMPTSAQNTQSNPFRDAVNHAMEAATLTQTANTADEWNTVAEKWQQAIALMQAVPAAHPSYETAQAKVAEYQKNLEYARQSVQKAQAAAQRMTNCEAAVRAAARVSAMADQVEDLDPAIRTCQSMDDLTAATKKFPAALDGADPKTFVSNRCTYEESLKTTPICQTLLATAQTVYYLAARPGSPTPDDPIPVFRIDTKKGQEAFGAMLAAVEAQDPSRVESILAAGDFSFIPGGSIVEIVDISGDIAVVKLRTRDIQGNDLSGQVRGTLSRFVQSRKYLF